MNKHGVVLGERLCGRRARRAKEKKRSHCGLRLRNRHGLKRKRRFFEFGATGLVNWFSGSFEICLERRIDRRCVIVWFGELMECVT